MQLGMVGLGRMGANMVRRLMRGGHACVAYDRAPEPVKALAAEGATGATTLRELVGALAPPRVVWMMIPAGVVDAAVDELAPLLAEGDTLVDGGNSFHADAPVRAARLGPRGIHYVDAGVSGGVWGLERGFCLMIGGGREVVTRLEPIFATLAPGSAAAGSGGSTAARGYLHCGPSGAGHFVKMVHNGIEYGLMAAYAEGLNILSHANVGSAARTHDAETAPLRHPERYRYPLDLAAITELWRHGSVVSSWLLDLTAAAFARDPELARFAGQVSDSGEGRWTLEAATDVGVPAHVLAAALFERFGSRGEDEFQNRVLSAMRLAFGGHLEKS
jgi:6-phosphogluconate dehydrogenase